MGISRADTLTWIMNKVRAADIPTTDPEWLPQTLADLERQEAYREYAYPDPLSNWGKLFPAKKYRWGFRPASVIMQELGLSPANAKLGAPWTVGIGFTHGVTYTSRTTRQQSYQRLREEVLDHAKGLDTLLPGWRSDHDLVIQTVLVNMIYNMGTARLSKFAPTLELIKKKEYKAAAARIRNTPYYKQTGNRSAELMKRLETGRIEPQHKI